MDPTEEKTSKTVDIYRDTWVRFLGMYCFISPPVAAQSRAERDRLTVTLTLQKREVTLHRSRPDPELPVC